MSARTNLIFASLMTFSIALTGAAFADALRSQPADSMLVPDLRVQALATALIALDPSVDPNEAQRAATLSYATAAELRVEYRMVSPPQLHNMLVKLGMREHGLCCDWAAAMVRRLHALELRSLQVHWIVAHHGDVLREHNSALLSAVGGDVANGIVIDGWRNAGELYWSLARDDRYAWTIHPDSREWAQLECR